MCLTWLIHLVAEISQSRLESGCQMTLRCLRRLGTFDGLLGVLDPSPFLSLPGPDWFFTYPSTVPLPQTCLVHTFMKSSPDIEMGEVVCEEAMVYSCCRKEDQAANITYSWQSHKRNVSCAPNKQILNILLPNGSMYLFWRNW